MPDFSAGELTVTIAVSDRGNYHLAHDLKPLCGAKPTQRPTEIPADEFKAWPFGARYNCGRCYWLRSTNGRWDGR